MEIGWALSSYLVNVEDSYSIFLGLNCRLSPTEKSINVMELQDFMCLVLIVTDN